MLMYTAELKLGGTWEEKVAKVNQVRIVCAVGLGRNSGQVQQADNVHWTEQPIPLYIVHCTHTIGTLLPPLPGSSVSLTLALLARCYRSCPSRHARTR